MKVEKNPMRKIMYQYFAAFQIFLHFSKQIKNSPNSKSIDPWATSPNITANKNGKVIIVNTVGLNSL